MLASLLVPIAFTLTAHADDAPRTSASSASAADGAAEARRQYNLGKVAYDAGRYAEAALAWEAAAAIKAHAATLYSAALAWEKANHPERAADDFVRALVVPGLNAQLTSNATDRLADLEHALGSLDVTGAEGTRVQLDALTEVPVPARLHAMPGAHTLAVHVPGQSITRRDVPLEAGQVVKLSVDAPTVAPLVTPPVAREAPEAPAPPPAPPPRPKPPVRSFVGFGLIGMGVATLGATIVLGIEALGARDAYNAAPTHPAYSHAESLQTWTTVSLVAGSVLAAGGIALVVWPSPKARASTAALRVLLSPGAAIVRGDF